MGVRDSTVLVLMAMRFDSRASVRASQANATRACANFALYMFAHTTPIHTSVRRRGGGGGTERHLISSQISTPSPTHTHSNRSACGATAL